MKSLSGVRLLATPLTAAYLKLSAAAAKLLQSCPTLCDPIDGLLPGSSVLGIFQEWGAIAFSHIYAQACLNN